MAKENLYDQSLTNPYTRFVHADKGLIWSVTAGAASATTAWADSYTVLTWDAVLGAFPITIPAALGVGVWDMLIYDNAVPAATDQVKILKRIRKSSAGGLGPMDQTLLDI